MGEREKGKAVEQGGWAERMRIAEPNTQLFLVAGI